MSDRIFFPPADPLGRTATLAFDASFPVLGVPLRVRSNAEAVLDHAAAAFGAWRGLPDALIDTGARAELDVIVHPATDEALPDRLVCRRHGDVVIAAGGPVLATILIRERRALVFVPAQALSAEAWFDAHVCGQAILAVAGPGRVALHAAAVVAGDHTLLLTGASGAGKSTMAYACAAAGFSVLAEDRVYAELSGDNARLWGYTPQLGLAPDAAGFFPELAAAPIVPRGDGTTRLRAEAATPWAPTLTTSGRVSVVLLDRSAEEPSLTPIDGEEAAAFFDEAELEGIDHWPVERAAVAAWLHRLPTWRLDAGDSPHRAARLLEALVAVRQPIARGRRGGGDGGRPPFRTAAFER
jgi:hypothetical protein